MPLKTSYFKKELWKQGFRSSGWIGIAYFIGLLFVMPLMLVMWMTSPDSYWSKDEKLENLFYINGEFQLIFLMFIPVLAAIFTFRFMQVKGSSDFIHSLPLSRTQIFIQQYLMGLSMLLLPILVNGVILYIVQIGFQLQKMYTIADIGWWMFVSLVFALIIYSFACLIGVLTGLSTVQAGLTYIFLFFPIGIYLLLSFNLEFLLLGYSVGNQTEEFMTKLSPIMSLIEYVVMENDSIGLLWIYLGASIVFFLLSIYLYRIRDAEAANQALAFSIIKPIFRFGVTICFMLLGGVYFGFTQGSMLGWIIFGYIFGAFLGYTLAEMLIQKTWRVFPHYKGFLVYIGISMFLLISVAMDWYGYEKRIPNEVDIEGIYIDEINSGIFNMYYSNSDGDHPNIVDPALIKNVTTLHESIVQSDTIEYSLYQEYGEHSTEIDITYFLKNGKQMNRSYFIDDYRDLDEYLLPILESETYKLSGIDWLVKQDLEIAWLEGIKGSKEFTDKEFLQKLLDAVREDYRHASYEELRITNDGSFANFNFHFNNGDMFSLNIGPDFKNVIQILHEEGLDHLLPLDAEDYSMVAVTTSLDDYYEMYHVPYDEELKERWIIFEEESEIDNLLTLSDYENANQGIYIAFYDKQHDSFVFNKKVNREDLPDFVKSRLKEIE